jgi:hypothetical protein
MTTTMHPIQAKLEPFEPKETLRLEKYCGAKTICVGCFLSSPCMYYCPLDGRIVTECDPRAMPSAYVDAMNKMAAAGVLPVVIFPGGNVAPTGDKMVKDAQTIIAENDVDRLDKARLARYNHPLFDAPIPQFKPSTSDCIGSYYNGFWDALISYTLCLPLTIAKKTNSCGCSEKYSDEQVQGLVSGMIEAMIQANTGKPNAPARQRAAMLFAAGCWDGPTLVNKLAPSVNDAVNENWFNIQKSTHVGGTVGSMIFQELFKSPGYNPDVERMMLLHTKRLIIETCIKNCNHASNAWDNTEAKASAKGVGKWVLGKLDVAGDVLGTVAGFV